MFPELPREPDRRPDPSRLLIRPCRLRARLLSRPVPLLDLGAARVPEALAPRRPRSRVPTCLASAVEIDVPALTMLPIRGSSNVDYVVVLVNSVLVPRRSVSSADRLVLLPEVVPRPLPSREAVLLNVAIVTRPVLVVTFVYR